MSFNRRNNGGNGWNGGNGAGGQEQKPQTLLIVTSPESDKYIATITTYSRGGMRYSSIAIYEKSGSVGGHDRWTQLKYFRDQEPSVAMQTAERALEQIANGKGEVDEL